MSEVRVSGEWIFGDIANYFKVLDFKRNLKITLSAVGKMYIVCALMHNARTFLYGNTTSEYFGVKPQTITEHFSYENTLYIVINMLFHNYCSCEFN